MSLSADYLEREAVAWTALQAALDEGRDALGWSSSAVAGHLAFWIERAASALEAMAAGSFDAGGFALDIDAENDRRLPEWEAIPITEAREHLDAARDRLLAAWSALEEPDARAAGWFSGDSFEHYDEHVTGE